MDPLHPISLSPQTLPGPPSVPRRLISTHPPPHPDGRGPYGDTGVMAPEKPGGPKLRPVDGEGARRRQELIPGGEGRLVAADAPLRGFFGAGGGECKGVLVKVASSSSAAVRQESRTSSVVSLQRVAAGDPPLPSLLGPDGGDSDAAVVKVTSSSSADVRPGRPISSVHLLQSGKGNNDFSWVEGMLTEDISRVTLIEPNAALDLNVSCGSESSNQWTGVSEIVHRGVLSGVPGCAHNIGGQPGREACESIDCGVNSESNRGRWRPQDVCSAIKECSRDGPLRENINPEVSKKLDFNPVVAACNGGVKSAAQDIIVVADASAVGETGYCRDMLDLKMLFLTTMGRVSWLRSAQCRKTQVSRSQQCNLLCLVTNSLRGKEGTQQVVARTIGFLSLGRPVRCNKH
ncbi:hypothetical protein PVAP13_2KG217500 [Panicum virgatum]|uniref:Uncharacterized protein n=1 Tax=Panicum virgatum TaxID=38727 RepID=A0A8T0VY88_PANVG|nr:hypothetical protein PVAP13_2KG217500 [Panicum virgatum]